jgi:hypothetical protein
MSRLEQFDRIPVRILNLDLATTGTGFHLVAKMKFRYDPTASLLHNRF